MPAKPIADERVRAIFDAVSKAITEEGYRFGAAPSAISEIARRVGVPKHHVESCVRAAKERFGLAVPTDAPVEFGESVTAADAELLRLGDENRRLKTELANAQSEAITRAEIWRRIAGYEHLLPEVPTWVSKPKRKSKVTGVPFLMLSDWHWAEVVRPSEVSGVNAYNLEIAHKRVKRLVATAIELLTVDLANARYDGIVIGLGGDMFSGDIHEELKQTNENPVIPSVLDLLGVLVWLVNQFADIFGRVFVVGVTGNHGRNTKKIQAKERWATSYDWLLYALLARHFENDKRVTIAAPEAPEYGFSIYGHRYLLTHGDEFRGGDGIIGPLGPATRGRVRKQSRDTTMNRGFDTLVMGHWHTLAQLPNLVINGSLKGYDEFAMRMNFAFERPAQAMWITHPEHGITHQMPIYLEDPSTTSRTWLSVPA